ncbi:MAG TPA: GNAT family N-acetyltransferase [Caulobacterales bacterium]|nr:GNAT family N-acetyltransferase [Caulobacterales bacterium]
MFDPARAPVLETPRLVLRAWRDEDFEPFAAMMAAPPVARFLTGDQRPQDRAGAWRTLSLFVGHWALRGFGLFAVEEKRTGSFVGRVGLWRPEAWVGLELGWGLAPAYWGRGYALEAARSAGDWAFTRLQADELVSLIHVDNTRSQNLAARLGMKPATPTLHAGMPHTIWKISRDAWAETR